MNRFYWLVMVAVFISPAQQLAAQQLAREELVIRALEEMQTTVETLDGQVAGLQSTVELFVNEMVKDQKTYDEFMRILKPTARFVGETTPGNQKQAFFEELTRLACRNFVGLCQLEQKYRELLERVEALEGNRSLEPSPAPAPAPDLAPQFVPPPQFVPVPPAPAPMPTQPRVWLGRVDRITSFHDVSPYARRIARCVNLDSADGIPCHGDMYKEPNGELVFVKHVPRAWNRSVLAVR